MPRISGKAQLTTQLKALWLAHVVSEMLHGEDNLGEEIKFLGQLGIRSSPVDIEGSGGDRSEGGSSTMILPWILDNWEEGVETGIDDLVLEGGSRESGGDRGGDNGRD